ncbi:MAG: hypothetical protein ACLP19_18960 [Xanthobacteraceae bacterium]
MVFISEPRQDSKHNLPTDQIKFVDPDNADFDALFERRWNGTFGHVPPREPVVPNFIPTQYIPPEPPRVWSPEEIAIHTAFINNDKKAIYEARRASGYLNDADISSMLEEISGDDMGFFWTNKSSHTYEQLQALYCSVMPSVLATKDNPKIFAGYHHDKRTPKSVVQGIFCRFNEIKSIPCGYNTITRTFNRFARPLPRLMSVEIDIKDNFLNFFPGEYPADIFETHNIPRPFFTAENPLSGHCHVGFLIKYSADEWMNVERTSGELKPIWKEFTHLIGGDPSYDGHTIRSPWFITGFHKQKPTSDTGNLIDINKECTYHKSTFYEPHEYSLDELRELIVYLKALHGDMNVHDHIDHSMNVHDHSMNHTNIHNHMDTNSRNVSIFNKTRKYAYPIAYRYSLNSFDAFVNVLMGYAFGQNSFSNKHPLPVYELRSTCRSIARFCLKSFNQPQQQQRRCGSQRLYNHSSELQSLRACRRWGYNYTTNKMKADANGISESTYYRRLAKAKKIADAEHASASARVIVANLIKKSSGHRRDANGRIVYKTVPRTPINAFTPLIKKAYCHPQSLELADVTYESTGPPFDG